MAAAALQQLDSVDAALAWLHRRGARALTTDSRHIGAGDAFLAWPGYAVDARRFVAQALEAGASACLVEAEGAAAFDLPGGAAVAALHALKARAGAIASGYMGVPSEHLNVIAITGTNGKTSTAWWTAQALGTLGQRCGVIGTLGVGEPPHPMAAQSGDAAAALAFTGMTTPDPVTVQAGLKRFVEAGLKACAIEATSIGLAEHRLGGTKIDTAVFTNFTQDHLDYHGSMESYWEAKAGLFAWPGLSAAVVNDDDARGAALAEALRSSELDLWTYSTGGGSARLRAGTIRYEGSGLCFEVEEGQARASVRTALIGDYNVANLLATLGALRASGIALADAAAACAQLTPVPGRMQRVATGPASPQVVVDYAHTPDALEQALRALRTFAAERGGRLWCVFGCGGNRDAGKRPLMGALAQRLADRVVVTSDNPRLEAPAEILDQIVAGLVGARDHVEVIEDRREAIARALEFAAPRDVVLIAGKGHEEYQDVAGIKHPFSDVEAAGAALAAREAAAS
jgi:UDP-N-acetylmuramyl-tripeptide synthetase